MKYFYLFITSFIILLSSCSNSNDYSFQKDEGMVWNTLYHITYRGPEELKDSVRPVLDGVSRSLSIFDPSSLVTLVNKRDTTPVDTHFIRVYKEAKRINERSLGAFDPTLSPLITAWGFGPGHKATADTVAVDSIMKFVGLSKTHLVGSVLIKDDPRTQFNFSALAKGYGVDCVAEMFQNNGVNDYLIEIGGEIRAAGSNPSGGKWSISIDRPIYSDSIEHESQVIIEFTGLSLATSGNYRNYHLNGDQKYGHTISAITGRPVQTDVLSVSVLAPTCMEADAFATALMTQDSKNAIAAAVQIKRPVMIITSDRVWMSASFEQLLKAQ